MTDEETTEPKKLSMVELLESAPHFAYLTFEDKKEMVQYLESVEYMPGDIIIHEAAPQEHVFFIFTGSVEVIKSNATGEKVPLATLKQGEIIGEAAMSPVVEDSTVMIRAREKTGALSLSKQSYQRMMVRSSKLAFKLLFDVMRIIRTRLNDVSNRLADQIVTPDEKDSS